MSVVFAADMKLKKLQLELQHKAEEMQQLRQELSLLKVNL